MTVRRMATHLPHPQSVEDVSVGACADNDIKGGNVYEEMSTDPCASPLVRNGLDSKMVNASNAWTYANMLVFSTRYEPNSSTGSQPKQGVWVMRNHQKIYRWIKTYVIIT
jgi:hypothetical protein